jgi:hypothetical protein
MVRDAKVEVQRSVETSQVLTDTPLLAAGASRRDFRVSGSRRVMRALKASSGASAGAGCASLR